MKPKTLARPICWVVGHYPAGPTGIEYPIENHHCGRCGVALYQTIKMPDMEEMFRSTAVTNKGDRK